MVLKVLIILAAVLGARLLNRAWQRSVSRTPVDPASPGDLEELVGNAGGLFIYVMVAAVAGLALWLTW